MICGDCHEPVCKTCAQFLDEYSFSYAPERLAEITKRYDSANTFCSACFDQKIAVDIAHYMDTLESAKKVSVFFKKQSKETRLIKRREDFVHVADCPDYDEAILRLAFQAASVRCNALIDVVLDSKKVKIGTYNTTSWSGRGRPARVDEKILSHDRIVLNNPN